MRTNRQGIIVWFQHMKNLRQIKRYGHLIYTSKKLKYAVLYVDQDDVDNIEKKLLRLSFVSKIDRSYKPFIRTNYENAKPDKAKQYDYKMGI
ncbi:YlbG family protein [Virgibacillus sp. FSP13]